MPHTTMTGAHSNYQRHDLSAAFDVFDDEDLTELTASIKKLGVIQHIVLHEGKVLDGWNRYKIAREVGATARIVELTPDVDPREFVRAQNLARRHLTKSQKATMIVRLNEWRPVGVQDDRTQDDDSTATTEEMANQAGVSTTTIEQAKKAELHGKGDEVLSGEKSLQQVVDEIKREPVDEPAEPTPAPKKVKPRKPSPTDQLKVQLRERDATIAAQSEEISGLQMMVKGYELEVSGDHKGVLREMSNLQANIRTLKGSLGEAQSKLRDCKFRGKQLEKRIAELESQLSTDAEAPTDVEDEDAIWED